MTFRWGQFMAEKRSIIIVDDEDEVRNILKEVFEMSGYNVFAAPNGLKLIAMLRAEKIDVVLLDINMPWISGYEICRSIKKDERLKKIKSNVIIKRFRKLRSLFSDSQVKFALVSVDLDKGHGMVEGWYKQYHPVFPLLHDSSFKICKNIHLISPSPSFSVCTSTLLNCLT